jgi:hypothetical protein
LGVRSYGFLSPSKFYPRQGRAFPQISFRATRPSETASPPGASTRAGLSLDFMGGAAMNTIEQLARPFVTPLEGSEGQTAVKLRKRLEDVLSSVLLVHDVVTVCVELSQGSTGDFNAEIANVLRRCAADRLRFQMTVLTNVIERLGNGNVEAASPGRTMA